MSLWFQISFICLNCGNKGCNKVVITHLDFKYFDKNSNIISINCKSQFKRVILGPSTV